MGVQKHFKYTDDTQSFKGCKKIHFKKLNRYKSYLLEYNKSQKTQQPKIRGIYLLIILCLTGQLCQSCWSYYCSKKTEVEAVKPFKAQAHSHTMSLLSYSTSQGKSQGQPRFMGRQTDSTSQWMECQSSLAWSLHRRMGGIIATIFAYNLLLEITC